MSYSYPSGYPVYPGTQSLPPSPSYPGLPGPDTAMPPTYSGPYPTYGDVWWDRALGWLGKKLGLDNVADEDDFWLGAQQGVIMCSGPFFPEEVYALLTKATPEQVSRVRMSVAARSWYRKFPPADLPSLAGMLVAEAHGGRDCSPQDAESRMAAQAIRSLAAEAPAEVPGLPAMDTLTAGLPMLAVLGLGAWFLLSPTKKNA